jgi:glucose-6-phosphate 1-dehydrogenase
MALADVARDTVRGQYAAGAVDGQPVKGYLEEDNVPADSHAETFVALRAHQQLALGQRAVLPAHRQAPAKRQSEIVIEFADLPFSIFPSGPRNYGNRLVIQLQPEESIQLQMLAKEPGSGMKMLPVSLNLDLQQAIPERRAGVRASADRRDRGRSRTSCAATNSKPHGRGSSRFSTAGRN